MENTEKEISSIKEVLRKFSEWKILDEDRQKNLFETQEIIKSKVEGIVECMNELKLLLVKTYVTKEEFVEFQKTSEDKFDKVFQKIEQKVDKTEMEDPKDAIIKNLIDFGKTLLYVIVILAGAKLTGSL